MNTCPWRVRGLMIAAAFAATTGMAGDSETAYATLAAGCFWCTRPISRRSRPSSTVTYSGYTGGTVANPTYKQVSARKTGHAEAVRVVFDPRIISFEELLRNLLAQHRSDGRRPPVLRHRRAVPSRDLLPRRRTTGGGGEVAGGARSDQALCQPGRLPKLPPRLPSTPAEAYHQDYWKKNPIRYSRTTARVATG